MWSSGCRLLVHSSIVLRFAAAEDGGRKNVPQGRGRTSSTGRSTSSTVYVTVTPL